MSLKIFPYFQPIVETATGRIAGYEALARMEDESGNVVSAGRVFSDDSIPVKERIEIDRDVRLQALEALSGLPEDTFLSINISPEWLQFLESLDDLPTLKMMKQVAGDPRRIVIEITELDGELEIIKLHQTEKKDKSYSLLLKELKN